MSEATKYLDVMIDLETTGTDPERTSIIQISAVRFNYETAEIMPEMFDRCLIPAYGRFFDEETRTWWLKDKRAILEMIQSRMERPAVVLQSLREFLMVGIDPYNDQLRLWAKPSHFEYPFLQSYFRQFEIGNPLHYRTTNDMNSFIRGVYWPNDPPNYERELEFEGDAHNALFDVLHQIKVLFRVREDVLNKRSPTIDRDTPPWEVVEGDQNAG